MDARIGQEIADIISSIEANHIAVKMAIEKGDWKSVRRWKDWRVADYKRLHALGVPVYDPITENRKEMEEE